MADKEKSVYVKNIKSYFMNYDNDYTLSNKVLSTTWEDKKIAGSLGLGVVSKTSPRFPFGEKKWTDGIFTVTIGGYGDFVVLNNDYTGKVISIIPDLGKRMILHRVEIKLTPNIIEEHRQFLKFSLLRVKRSIHTTNVGNKNNLDDDSFIASDDLQLVRKGCFFNQSIVLEDINYNMTSDDDLVLIQKIEMDMSKYEVGLYTKDLDPKHLGYATNRYSYYDIVVHYSLGEI